MSLSAAWYRGAPWLLLLQPLAALYRWLAARRRRRLTAAARWRSPVPVIVVGNITVGGTGKTPLVIALVEHYQRRGLKVGVISRGYGGQAATYPLTVTPTTPVGDSGDEPALIVQATGCPLVVDPDRVRAAQTLLEQTPVDILISDDGLQHYRLQRDLELCVIDGARGLGNGRCLPAGPLREPASRLAEVDAVIVNGEPQGPGIPKAAIPMTLAPSGWQQLADGKTLALHPLPFTTPVHALAGIGNPARFFASLDALGVEHLAHPLPDHHRFRAADLRFPDQRPLIMTAKDAVKCRELAPANSWVLNSWVLNTWVLQVRAQLPEAWWTLFDQRIEQCRAALRPQPATQ